MNDDFICKALPKMRKDFAQSLYARISAHPHSSTRAEIYSMSRIPRRLQATIILLGLLVLVAWSQIRLWIRYVSIGDLWLIEFTSSTEQAPNDQVMPPIVPTLDLGNFWGPEVYLTPDWIPDGFSATKFPGAGYAYEDSIGMWSNEAQETIRLFYVPKAGGARPYAPPGMYKEVRINDQPAVLIYGRLAPNSPENPQAQRQWDETLGLQLSWSLKGNIFTLETLGPYVSEGDLIRMAESLKNVPASRETMIP